LLFHLTSRTPSHTQALVSLIKLFSSSTAIEEDPIATTELFQDNAFARLHDKPSSSLLRQEVAELEKQREALALTSEELKLIHERSARHKAIDVAESMLSSQKPPTNTVLSSPILEPVSTSSKAHQWCTRAAAQFGINEPVSKSQRWGSMQLQAYQEAWIAHKCDSKVFGHAIVNMEHITQTKSRTNPISTRPHSIQRFSPKSTNAVAFSYLKDANAPDSSRRTITVLVWNKIRGFLDWLRPDFKRDAREKCSTKCIFTDDKRELKNAHGVLFHAKTHSMSDFPRGKTNPKQKYMMVSLEQPSYAPLMKQKKYLDKFDYILTYDLDSTLPIITIHPHFSAIEYVNALLVQLWHLSSHLRIPVAFTPPFTFQITGTSMRQ